MLRWLGWAVTGTLVATAAYELALALGAGTQGSEPGEGVAGSGVVELVAVLSMVAAAVLAPFAAVRPWPAALFAPAAAAFLAAFFFTYDPYFAPDLRRHSDDGAVAGRWIAVVAVIALGNGVLTWLQPWIGRFTTSGILLLVLLTTVFAGDGH
jgi:hypothetical protein